MKDRRILWPLAAAGALAVVMVAQTWVWIRWWRLRFTLGEATLWTLPDLVIWAGLVPLVVRGARRFPLERENLWIRAPLHLLASIATALTFLLILWISDAALGWSRMLGAPPDLLSNPRYRFGFSIFTGMSFYWVAVAVTQARTYYGRFRDAELAASHLERDLALARLDALEKQLDPHFLFNALNSIAVLVRRDPDGAARMVTDLAALLRGTLDRRGSELVPLAQELALLDRYLDIEKVRLGERLAVLVTAASDTDDALVPPLVLQPLVENAVRHGVASRNAVGRIEVRAEREGENLHLSVEDSGPGFPDSGPDFSGIGLANTRDRLRMIYGPRHQLQFGRGHLGGARVDILIPLGGAT